MGKSYLFNPSKINVFKTHSLKIFNLAQQNLTKLLCRNCADIGKAYIGYVAIYVYFLYIIKSGLFKLSTNSDSIPFFVSPFELCLILLTAIITAFLALVNET